MAKVYYIDYCNAVPLGEQVAMLNRNSQRGGELVSLSAVGVPAPKKLLLGPGRRQDVVPVAVAFYGIEEWAFKDAFGRDYDSQEWEHINLGAQ